MLYLFGGQGVTGELFADLYKLDLTNLGHIKTIESKNEAPNPRSDGCMAIFQSENAKYLVLFGGESESDTYNDVWVFDIKTNK